MGKTKRHIISLCAIAALAAASMQAQAIDAVSVSLGRSTHDKVTLPRIGMQWDWHTRWLEHGGWHLTGYWDLDAGYWHGDHGQHRHIGDIGLTPILRYEHDAGGGFQPYIEAGVGAHLLTSATIEDKNLGTEFQFGDLIGFGLRFGERLAWEIGYRYEHFSNGDIAQPNPGIDFQEIRLGYHFD